MNREIKFRAWSNETMDYFPETHTESLNANFQPGGHGTGEEPIFMQYTGLKDRNGKMIYEGDVVDLSGYGDYVVTFPFIHLYESNDENDIKEIKGNIYENPELLD